MFGECVCVYFYWIWYGCEYWKFGDEFFCWMFIDILMLEIVDLIYCLLWLGGVLFCLVVLMLVFILIFLVCCRWFDLVVLVLFKIIIFMLVCGWVFGGGICMYYLCRIVYVGVLVGIGFKFNLWVGFVVVMMVDGDLGWRRCCDVGWFYFDLIWWNL